MTDSLLTSTSTTDAASPLDAPASACAPDQPCSIERWPAYYAFVTAWMRPAATGRNMTHVGLIRAFGVHLVSWIALFLAMACWVSIARDVPLRQVWKEIHSTIINHPGAFLTGLLIFVGLVEASCVLLALIITAWGARDEKCRSSLYHAMRTVWIQTPLMAMAFLAFIMVMACFFAWLDGHSSGSGPWNERPWYVRHTENCGLASFTLAGLWFLWGTLRAVGARPVKPVANPVPMCQQCGYNLSGSDPQGCCPECGEPVAASVGPDARPGIAWERRHDGGPHAGAISIWWTTCKQVIRRPRQFGRQMQTLTPPEHHRLFLLTHVVLTGVIGFAGPWLWWLGLVHLKDNWPRAIIEDVAWSMAPSSALLTSLTCLAASLLTAGILGFVFSLGPRRNIMPIAMRVACYMGAYWTLWALFNAALAFAGGLLWEWPGFDVLERAFRLGREELFATLMVVANLPLLGFYLQRMTVALKAARYATT